MPTNHFEVDKVIKSFENKNNSLNDLPFKLLKIVSIYIASSLTSIFNLILNTGVYPDCLKSARVTPLYKKGDTSNPNNYRPISVLTSINKIFERLLFSRLNGFTQHFNITAKRQYGFTPNCGIMDAFFDLLSSIRLALNYKKFCLITFCDFSKAFDTLDHKRLLFKLSRIGIRGIALDLIESYLSGRTQSVSIKGISSDSVPIVHGVPQGSILSPWLFNMYVNDLSHYLSHCPPIQYANNTTIIDSDTNIDLLMTRMQTNINTFYKWTLTNYLSLNASKTKIMIFKKKRFIGPYLPIIIGDQYLQQVPSTKFLGVTIDCNLTFKEHIQSTKHKLSRLVGLSYVLGPSMNLAAAKSFYYALVQSRITYGLIFWGGTFETDIHTLQICQNKILRNLFCDKLSHNSTNELYCKLKILKISELHQLEVSKAVSMSLKLNKFPHLNNLLNNLSWPHDYETRSYSTFRLPSVSSVRDKIDFLFQSVLYWNNLPQDIKKCASINTFTQKMLDLLIGTYN